MFVDLHVFVRTSIPYTVVEVFLNIFLEVPGRERQTSKGARSLGSKGDQVLKPGTFAG